MKLQLRHIFLILSSTLIIVSFFYYVSAHTTYIILLITGLVTAIVSLILIWQRDTMRMKFFWTVIAILFALVQQMTEESSIRQSSKWMIQNNDKMLRDVSLILISKPRDLLLLKSDKQNSTMLFTAGEWNKITNLF